MDHVYAVWPWFLVSSASRCVVQTALGSRAPGWIPTLKPSTSTLGEQIATHTVHRLPSQPLLDCSPASRLPSLFSPVAFPSRPRPNRPLIPSRDKRQHHPAPIPMSSSGGPCGGGPSWQFLWSNPPIMPFWLLPPMFPLFSLPNPAGIA
ncbi:hypothetical protein G7046_g6424 [Stylonectria norvegica]|nr:hypothetical protein G7046_g6424 [Stylonectria norvegica]